MTVDAYNPLDKINLARSIEAALLEKDVVPLSDIQVLPGAGVYALYYRGSCSFYSPMTAINQVQYKAPIYIGKAIPKGGRKGGLTRTGAPGTPLVSRLRKHARSIAATDTLRLDDFAYRCLVLDDIWIPLGENILIETFRPAWNIAIEGFGINAPGSGRMNQKLSPWDVLHPGRSYVQGLTGRAPERDQVLGRLEDYFAGRALRALPPSLAVETVDEEES